ncbi:MAG TPA: acyl carrier protein [Schlesneria sp.]|jgi:acyl carrier protein
MANSITDKILTFLIDSTGEASLQPDTDLLASGLLDSLTMMDLVVFVEMEFQQRIAVEDMRPEMFRSVGTIAQLIERMGFAPSQAA